jgi:hypothetical protein
MILNTYKPNDFKGLGGYFFAYLCLGAPRAKYAKLLGLA